ncbi:MAG: pyruvate formate lyase family protein [Planctomycetota bacterium]
MNDRLTNIKRRIRTGEHKRHRLKQSPDVLTECQRENLSWMKRAARLTRRQCEVEKVTIEPDERILFTRTVPDVPAIYLPEEWDRLTAGRKLHELGPISNICADWAMILSQGLIGRKQVALKTRSRSRDPKVIEFIDSALETIDAVLALAKRYADATRQMGMLNMAEILDRVPANGARTFHEALQSVRLCHAVVWLSGHYHVGLGRFDQYMWPYLKADIETGRLAYESAEELLAEFFISLNKDSDLYPGVQQGDNGQSLMLGGVNCDGSNAVNELTRMVLRIDCDVCMIDPKINLRVSKDTDLALLELATHLTRKGLGFPQYSNDDVVIPALVKQGYSLEDARDYTVAACWEFIIPGKSMEVTNTGAVSLPYAADVGIRQGLATGKDFQGILELTAQNIRVQTEAIVELYRKLLLPPAPYYSVLMDGCLERGVDLSQGCVYNNFGIHGACPANAADALAAVKKLVFETHMIEPFTFIDAIDNDYQTHEEIIRMIDEYGPKVGNNDDEVDDILVWLYEVFADTCESIRDNGRGGKIRPGTGSAMYYIWLTDKSHKHDNPIVAATAEGRRKGQPFSANLAPSLNAHARGPVSVIQSFSKIDYQRICNGGPITMELSDTVFRNAESIHKVAMLIRIFAQLGCQQMQLNTLNRERLLDAKAHPERHRDLIVRVWGWSGYFCELASEYQDHIIARQSYG